MSEYTNDAEVFKALPLADQVSVEHLIIERTLESEIVRIERVTGGKVHLAIRRPNQVSWRRYRSICGLVLGDAYQYKNVTDYHFSFSHVTCAKCMQRLLHWIGFTPRTLHKALKPLIRD